MEFDFFTRSAKSFGGNTTYSLVGQLLQSGLGNYGDGVKSIELCACFRGGRVGHVSLKPSYDRFHSEFLPSLPTIKFLRKKAQIVLNYETRVAEAEFLRRYGYLSADIFSKVIIEAAETLHLIDAKLKKSDDFDLVKFHRDIATIVNGVPDSDERLRELQTHLDNEWRKRIAAMSPWERVDIDWEEFHPAARQLLNDPFLWSLTNDYAPHGNDTGADLLAYFKKWNTRHPNDAAFQMAVAILENWKIGPIDPQVTAKDEVLQLIQTDSIALRVTNEAMIAVAFAAVKHRGWCDESTIQYAMNAIARESVTAHQAMEQSKDVSEWLQSLDVLSAVLLRIPTQAPREEVE